MENTTAYRAARRHINRKIGFYIHLAVYLTINGGLLLSNRLEVPLFDWGIGLLFHGLTVFLNKPGAAWKQRMIENELKKK
jgi:2TM domain